MNIKLAVEVLARLRNIGVSEFCISPGARNAPLIDAFTHFAELKRFYFFDERAAAFFALGKIKSTNKPVAVVTTSGTAVGELLPAAMEAYYAGLPIVFLTADRPRSYRGLGAPQAAEQVNIFGIYAKLCLDVAGGENFDISSWNRMGPLHINLCFDEPLLDGGVSNFVNHATHNTAFELGNAKDWAIEAETVNSFLAHSKYPLVILGGIQSHHVEAIRGFLEKLKAPIYAEAQSGLREDPRITPYRLKMGDFLMKVLRSNGWPVDAVLRIGGVPTHRLWRDLEGKERHLPVCSVSTLPFSGLTRSQFAAAPLDLFFESYSPPKACDPNSVAKIIHADEEEYQKLVSILEEEPTSEPGIFHTLSKHLPKRSRIFIGNSLPIREWDLAASFSDNCFEISGNRGLNGIDGQISTFLGYCREGRENWGIFGDLTALYDATAPWIIKQIPEIRAQTVVINNSGGKIFHRMFPKRPEFLNSHNLNFTSIAELWELKYERWTEVPDGLEAYGKENTLIEVIPDLNSTSRFWEKYDRVR